MKETVQVTREEILAFLNGEGPLEGVHFGDVHPSGKGFWWRKYLACLSATSAPAGVEATPLASEQITQEDREAAWKYRPACYWLGDDTMKKWMAGAYDTAAPVIADFARHRIAALSATPAPSGQGVSGEGSTDLCSGHEHGGPEGYATDGQIGSSGRPEWTGQEPGSADTTKRLRCDNDPNRRADTLEQVLAPAGCDGPEDTPKPAPAPSCAPGEVERLRAACRAMLDEASDYYTARNGRIMTIEGADGEKCWIVPFDPFEDVRRALAALSPAPGATAQDGGMRERVIAAMNPHGWLGDQCVTDIIAALTPTPTIPAGMVADQAQEALEEAHALIQEAKGFAGPGDITDHLDFAESWLYKIDLTPLAAAPKQAEQQGVEQCPTCGGSGRLVGLSAQTKARIAKALASDRNRCANCGGSDFKSVIAGDDGEAFCSVTCADQHEALGCPLETGAEYRTRDALAALNAPTGAVEKGEAK